MATIRSAVSREFPSATRRSTAAAALCFFTSAAAIRMLAWPTPVAAFGSMTPPLEELDVVRAVAFDRGAHGAVG
jgi:hypothetical protein